MKVLVTEAERRNALAMIRALSKRSCEVHAAGHSRFSQSFFSNACSRSLLYPDPASEPKRFIHFLVTTLGVGGYDVLLPAHDFTTIAISRYQQQLQGKVSLVVPPHPSCELARDKSKISSLAEELGLAIPKTFCPKSLDEAVQVAERVPFPCVLKPRKGVGAKGVRYLSSRQALISCYSESKEYLAAPGAEGTVYDVTYPIIQEFIPGETHDLCFLFRKGEPRALLTQRRLKTYPAQGGRSILVETTDEPELIRIGQVLLEELAWHGPGQLEFRMDRRDGKPKLIEMNTRFWGSVDLSIQAGIDFPFLACRLALEGDIEPQYSYRVGSRYRMWLPYELAWACQVGTLSALRESLIPDRKSHCAVRLNDPLPHFVELLYLLVSQIRAHKGFRARRGSSGRLE